MQIIRIVVQFLSELLSRVKLKADEVLTSMTRVLEESLTTKRLQNFFEAVLYAFVAHIIVGVMKEFSSEILAIIILAPFPVFLGGVLWAL
jgi:hypothetical protein